MSIPWRTFSIFISSTFADMQAERDIRNWEGMIFTEGGEYEIDAKGHRIIVQPVWKWLLENGS